MAAYTATLISNWNETSSPTKRSVRQRLNQFDIDVPRVGYWENSKNIELSTFSEVFNVGGGVEADIIHSPETKLPRSITTRFDLEVFNNHLNIFEVSFERLLKQLIFHVVRSLKYCRYLETEIFTNYLNFFERYKNN